MTTPSHRKIRRALLSVFDKSRLIEVVQVLDEIDVKLVATGSTAQTILQNGFDCKEVSEVTGFPEILDGRVKTLHPRIHAGILAKSDNIEHQQTLQNQQIEPFDLVVTGLYPFEKTADRTDASFEDIIEMIDIGGPTIIRSAAKNHPYVCVITDISQYDQLIQELTSCNGATSLAFRKQCAIEAFSRTAHYDSAIASWFARGSGQTTLPTLLASETKKLAYGENPHQQAYLYTTEPNTIGAVNAPLLQEGKPLGYNNYVDADFAFAVVSVFKKPAISVIKHKVSCGFACHESPSTALKLAVHADLESAFGGIIAANQTVTLDMALLLDDLFLEVIIAPDFHQDALDHLKNKKNLRILATGGVPSLPSSSFIIKQLRGGFLAQSPNTTFPTQNHMTIAPEMSPPLQEQWDDIDIAVKLASFANSNAIAIVAHGQLIGIGSGQTSRVRSCNIAVQHAQTYHSDKLSHAVAASDGFFPFFDGIQTLADSGIRLIAHPGGSKNDPSILAEANQKNITLVQHGIRSFSH